MQAASGRETTSGLLLLLAADGGALLGHRALHEQHQKDERHPQDGATQKTSK